jgi:hypothetical protein
LLALQTFVEMRRLVRKDRLDHDDEAEPARLRSLGLSLASSAQNDAAQYRLSGGIVDSEDDEGEGEDSQLPANATADATAAVPPTE